MAPVPAPSLPQQALTFNDVFEDADDEPQQQHSVQHIRANSSIMQLKKILGELLQTICASRAASIARPTNRETAVLTEAFCLQSPTVVKSVSHSPLPADIARC